MFPHLPTVLIIIGLVLFFGLLIYGLIRDKKKNKSSCCGGCAGCTMNCAYRNAPPKDTETNTTPSSRQE
ncbi:MAG: FeoB-associated Cys-rich membrane protein [Clostridia bacterium]|nr:FeoB-associated Cys-rich membrane protein [Clostridia bacterium]